jgi:ferredoxin/flavodoxin
MTIEIYYFTGTGNSLAIARVIAKKTDGILLSIATVIDKDRITTKADTIGIVFPCYLAQFYGLPLIVECFVKKLADIESKYIFAVCNYGYFGPVNALPTLKNLSKLIRSKGGRLSGEFSVRLPPNNLDFDHVPVPLERNLDIIFKTSSLKVDAICQRIIKKRNTRYKAIKLLVNFLLYPMYAILHTHIQKSLKAIAKVPADSHLSFRELIPLTDNSICVDDKCNGCGMCAKACPVKNILIIDRKPVWKHHCEMCFACDEWCPQRAIHHWGKIEGKNYHHPDIKISDMYNQSGS